MRMGMINMTASPSISSSSSILSFAPLSKLNHLSIDNMDEALPEELLRNLISLRTLYLKNVLFLLKACDISLHFKV
jgi:hypothetical protein